MKEVKDIAYVIIGCIVALIVLWWIDHAVAWSMQRKDQQRAVCVKETHNPEFCQAEW